MINPPISIQPIPLWAGAVPCFDPALGQPEPTLTPYILRTPKPAGLVLVLPGGGYVTKAPHEAEPIARWLNSVGVSAAVVDYRVAPYHHPVPLLDAKRAVQLVRSLTVEWGIDPHRIGLLGFSAGGHLASTVGTHLAELPVILDDPISQISSRPDALILCYPVISFGSIGHQGSVTSLLGGNSDARMIAELSNETRVTTQTPPTFLWHTADDEAVPVENTLAFAKALSASQVPFEVHIFPHGNHGLGLAQDDQVVGQWTGLCEKWLGELDFIG